LQAHRSHLYQRLLILGYSHKQVLLVQMILAAACAVLAMLIAAFSARTGLVVFFLAVALVLEVGYTLIVMRLENRRKQVIG
ncbi:MAG: hypothetical protein V2A74_11490, partial [bacterium]